MRGSGPWLSIWLTVLLSAYTASPLEAQVASGAVAGRLVVTSVVWGIPVGSGPRSRAGGALGALVNDWTVTGMLTMQSGVPIPVSQSTNNNGFAGFLIQRPNLIGDPALPDDQRSVNRWFDTSAFAAAGQFELGTSSRNPVRGPSYRNLDLALIRRVTLPASKALEVRAEIFNATNTPPLGAPNGVFGTGAFGTITTAGDPRVIQLALKFLY
jgi:hypothetical protein